MAIINNKMQCGIMKELETRARDITMGNHGGQEEINSWQSNMKDIALGNLIGRKKSSRTRLIIHRKEKNFG